MFACDQPDILLTSSWDGTVKCWNTQSGQLLIAMGSDASHKIEVEPAALAKADLFVCDRQSQCESLGELHHAIDAGLIDAEAEHPEIGQIISGTKKARTAESQLIICDLTGTGVQDTAIATLAYGRCRSAGAGQDFES